MKLRLGLLLCVLCGLSGKSAFANPPTASYVFPAGAQRGTAVSVRVGGLFLHDKPAFELTGTGVQAPPHLAPAKRVWFEGPVLPLPESQQQEDYPADYTGKLTVAKDAPLGARRVRLFTAQGGASGPVFVVGDLPEVIETETDGDPVPQALAALPVTANGRIFPREDVDLWEFHAEAGKPVTAFVHAASLNSPLVAKLELLDATGRVVAEQMPHACPGTDASLKFTPKASGKYRLRISDARANGGQAFVYRLTLTTADVPAFHFPLRAPADGLRDASTEKQPLAPPFALNGQIERPGIVGEWKLDLKKGAKYTFDLQARRFESPLCGVVRVLDATGKEVARAEATETDDPKPLAFAPPLDGNHTVVVSEKFRGRSGANFVYRLRVLDAAEKAAPGFKLAVKADVFTLTRGASANVQLTAERLGGFSGPIALELEGLPKGITVSNATIPANQVATTLALKADDTLPIGAIPLKIVGTAKDGDKALSHTAECKGETALRLAGAFPTPFKIVDEYVMTSAPRGETYFRKYKVDRGTFLGPIRVELADKQARHLQGVSGPVLTLKPGETDFEYPAFLPPWMEMGRTCRVCVMATATVRDPLDGREHVVSFSSTEQNQQMIVVVGPGRLDLSADRTSIRAEGEVRVTVKVSRAKALTGPATVELVLPEHIKGVRAPALTVPADKSEAEFVLTFDASAGPFNVPLQLRATVQTPRGPVTAETKLDAVK